MMEPVDEIRVQVLVDNVSDGLSSGPAHVRNEFGNAVTRGLRPASADTLCCAAHGLSLLLTARRGDTRHTVLFDTGPEDYAFGRNALRLGAAVDTVEAMVLSHGHWDHCGAALSALAAVRKGTERRVAVYTHPDMFVTRALRLPDGHITVMDGVPDPAQLTNAGADVIVTREPAVLLDRMFYLSGEIPRTTDFEPGMPGQLRRAGPGDVWEPDEVLIDERWFAVQVAGKGLIVFSACSHAGIVNVLNHARSTFPDVPLHAVVGGLHLAGPSEVHIPATVQALQEFGLRGIAPAHCTGWRAVSALLQAFGEDVVAPCAVGKSYDY